MYIDNFYMYIWFSNIYSYSFWSSYLLASLPIPLQKKLSDSNPVIQRSENENDENDENDEFTIVEINNELKKNKTLKGR